MKYNIISGSKSMKEEDNDLKHNTRMLLLLYLCRSLFMRIRIFIMALSGIMIVNIPAASIKPSVNRTNFEAAIGYGFPESICIKAKYGNNVQAGLFQSIDTHGLGPTGFEIYYRFGEKPRLMDQKPWYVMGGCSYFLFDVDYVKEYELLIYPRAGRSFYFSNISGVNLDIGLGFPLNRDGGGGNLISPVLISGSVSLFIRF
jgi:hypothetical protein